MGLLTFAFTTYRSGTVTRLLKPAVKKAASETKDLMWIYPVTDTNHIWSRVHLLNAQQTKYSRKKMLNTVKYMQSLKWQNRPTYRVFIWSAPAQTPELFSAALCTFKEDFSPCFLLRHISQLPTVSISTHVTVRTHNAYISKGQSHMNAKTHTHSCHLHAHTHTTCTHIHTQIPYGSWIQVAVTVWAIFSSLIILE